MMKCNEFKNSQAFVYNDLVRYLLVFYPFKNAFRQLKSQKAVLRVRGLIIILYKGNQHFNN